MNGKENKLLKELLQCEISLLRNENQKDHLRLEKILDDLVGKVEALMRFKIRVLTTAAIISGLLAATVSLGIAAITK